MMGDADADAFSARLVEVLRIGRAALCRTVRAGGAAFDGDRQSRLHRRGRRSRHDRDARLARLRAPRRHLPHHPHLALRPLPRHALGRGARAADRADAAPARGVRRHPARRRGAAALRCLPLRPAGRHPAVLAAHHQSRAALADRDDHGRRPAARRHHLAQAACLRRHARPDAARRTADPRLSGRASVGLPCRRFRLRGNPRPRCASSRPSRSS